MVFWDNRVLEMQDLEVGSFSVSYRSKNVEDNVHWCFMGVYGPTQRSDMGDF